MNICIYATEELIKSSNTFLMSVDGEWYEGRKITIETPEGIKPASIDNLKAPTIIEKRQKGDRRGRETSQGTEGTE